jgi:hypothetical protein
MMPAAGGRFERPRRAGRGQVSLTQRGEAGVQLRAGPSVQPLAAAMIMSGSPVVLVQGNIC